MVEEFPLWLKSAAAAAAAAAAAVAVAVPQEAATNVKVTKADGNTGGGPDATQSADQGKKRIVKI